MAGVVGEWRRGKGRQLHLNNDKKISTKVCLHKGLMNLLGKNEYLGKRESMNTNLP